MAGKEAFLNCPSRLEKALIDTFVHLRQNGPVGVNKALPSYSLCQSPVGHSENFDRFLLTEEKYVKKKTRLHKD